MTHQQYPQNFDDIARRIIRRLTLAHWVRLMGQTSLGIFTLLAVLSLASWYFGAGDWISLPLAIGLVIAWIGGTAVWAWTTRPTPIAALACWDEKTNRREMFLSAWWYEQKGVTTPGQQLHMRRAYQQVSGQLSQLSEDLPLSFLQRSWFGPLMFLALTSFLLVRPAVTEEPVVDENSRQQAKQMADALEESKKLLEEKEGLTPEERKKIEEFQQSLDQAQQKFLEMDNMTKKEMLAALEQQAREAEKLAQSLNDTGNELSSEMLAELARHVDTAELAQAMMSQNLNQTALEAGKIASQLRNKELTLEMQNRFEEALSQSLDKATPEDKQTTAGQNFEQAQEKLEQNDPQLAAKEFEELAERANQAVQRKNTQDKLEQLAQKLRNQGQELFNQNPTEMEQLAHMANDIPFEELTEMQPGQMNPMENVPFDPQFGQQPFSPPTPGAMPQLGQPPIPGTQTASNMEPGECPTGQCPIPGTGQTPGQMAQGQSPGQSQTPGQGMGQTPGFGQGQSPVPGTAVALVPSQTAGDGGLQAGNGSVPLANNSTNPLDPANRQTVNPLMQGEGPSQMRTVQAQNHTEQISRASQQVTLDFIQEQEQALAQEEIPPSRAGQVRRYFQVLRSQLSE